MEFNADNAQREAKAVEAVTGVLQEYMAGVLGKIKQQIDSYGRPNCYANGTFWERPKDPLFEMQVSATCATGVSPTELYHLDVFIWLPDCLPGFSGSFCCSCPHHHNLSHNGWNKILTIYHNFHVIFKRHFQPFSLSVLQLISNLYLSCSLALPPTLLQSHFQL
jgi:hypothetical protein